MSTETPSSFGFRWQTADYIEAQVVPHLSRISPGLALIAAQPGWLTLALCILKWKYDVSLHTGGRRAS